MLLAACGLIAGLQSCSDKDAPVNPDEFVVPEGMTKISIMIPDYDGGAASFSTRAYDTNEEGYMTNLYVIAIKYADLDQNGNPGAILEEAQRKVYTYALNPLGEKFKVGVNDYHLFNMALYPGQYRFAIIANYDQYLASGGTKITDFNTESEFHDIVLTFREDVPLIPRHLPMVCMPEEVKFKTKVYREENGKTTTEYVNKEGETQYNLVTIGGAEENVVMATMKFLCTKVRYTILFDKNIGGISELFGSSWIRFNVDDGLGPWATNIRRQTRLETESTGGGRYNADAPFITHAISTGVTEPGSWSISLDRYKWSDEGANYPLKPSSELEPWTETIDKWIPQLQKVWQGVVYLPENTGEETYTVDGQTKEIPSTVLKFPYRQKDNSLDDTPEEDHFNDPKVIYLFGNEKEDKYEGTDGTSGQYSQQAGAYKGLDRNYFYDVVAKVVNPDIDEMDVRIYVKILDWHETDQTIPEEDWLMGKK